MTCDLLVAWLTGERSEGTPSRSGFLPMTPVVSSLDLPLCPGARCLTQKKPPSTSSSRDSVVPSTSALCGPRQAGCTLVSFWASCDLVMRLARA